MSPWAIACCVLLALVAILSVALWWTSRAKTSGGPTPAEAEATGQRNATEMLHAPPDVVDARVERLRKRGRAGK